MATQPTTDKKRTSKTAPLKQAGPSEVVVGNFVRTSEGSITVFKGRAAGAKMTAGKEIVSDNLREIQTPRGDMVIVRIGGDVATKNTPSDQKASFLLGKFGKALSKPGVSRAEVFGAGKSSGTVYAYSLDPKDPTMIIREDAKGKRTQGKVVGGTFKGVRTARR